MHSHVAVLATTGIGNALWMYSDGVQRTKVATNSANFVFEDFVVESGFEFALSGGGGCDIHGSLTAAKDHKVFLWCYGGRI